MAPVDLERVLEESDCFQKSASDGVIDSTELRLITKGGEVRWMAMSRSVSERNPDGSEAQVVGSLTAITAQKAAEGASPRTFLGGTQP